MWLPITCECAAEHTENGERKMGLDNHIISECPWVMLRVFQVSDMISIILPNGISISETFDLLPVDDDDTLTFNLISAEI